ncbi:NADH-quinone oxidoreductase subunit J [Alphaproteobacteria bacterium]|nr:NADH-quinone oxidoreductase subunit J [Alphaproteobacteria bacterium]
MNEILFYSLSVLMLLSACQVVLCRHPIHSVLSLILCFLYAAGLFLMLGAEFLALSLAIVYVGAVAILFLFVVMMLDVDSEALKQSGFVGFGALLRSTFHLAVMLAGLGASGAAVFYGGQQLSVSLGTPPGIEAFQSMMQDYRPWILGSYYILAGSISLMMTRLLTIKVCRCAPREITYAFIRLFPLSFMGSGLFVTILLTVLLWGESYFATSVQMGVLEEGSKTGASNIQQLGDLLYTLHVVPFQGVGLLLLIAIIGAIALCIRQRSDVKRQNVMDQLAVTKEDVLERKKMKAGEGVSWPSH